MSKVLRTILHLLARREHAAAELLQKLSRRGFTVTEIQTALQYCQEHGYQSDSRFAEQYCRVQHAKGMGPLKILHGLRQYGLPTESLSHFIAETPIEWATEAKNLLNKNAWRFKQDPFSQKKMRFLLSRGFPSDIIHAVLKDRVDEKQ